MMKLFILPILLILNLNSYSTSSLDLRCDGKLEKSNCYHGVDLPLELDSNSFELLNEWSWISKRAQQKRTILQAEIDEHKNMLRYVRDGKLHDDKSLRWYKNEYEAIRDDFSDLKKITDKIQVIINKLNLCYKLCSAFTRIELEKDLEKTQSLKMALLTKRPLLAGPEIESLLVNNFEKKISQNDFDDKLKKTYTDYFEALQNSINQIDDVLNPVDREYKFLKKSRPQSIEARQKNYIDRLAKTHENSSKFVNNLLSDLDWSSELSDESNLSLHCRFYKQYKSHIENQNIKSLALDGAMIIGPFVAGPIFRIGAWGLRGANILKWGVQKEAAKKITALSMRGLSTAYFAKSLTDLNDKKKLCESTLDKFYQSKNRYEYYDYKNCVSEYQNALILSSAETAFSSIDGSIRLFKSLEFLKKIDFDQKIFNARDMDEMKYSLSKYPLNGKEVDEVGHKLQTSQRGDFYVFNVSESKDSKSFSAVGDRYWDYVAEIYNKRLKLSDEEIKSFIESSKSMSNRTTLVLNTEKGSVDKMRGGVALVTSSKNAEKMPFEKATGLKIPRQKGKRVAEIVRLTVGNSDPKLMNELIELLKSSVAGEKDIDKLYVYTSKVHARLYKRMGVPLKEISTDKRDVVFEIDVKKFLYQ